MRVVKLLKENETKLFDVLSKFGEVWAPVKKGDKFIYNKINNGADILENPLRTILPVKKLLIPPDYIMLDFTKNRFSNANKNIPSKVIIGIHPCGINALNILDKFYTADYKDTCYCHRRQQLIIIGKSCIPDEYCFCNKTHTDIVEEGYDLFMTDLGDYYLIWIGSSKGDDIIREGSEIFSEDVPADVAADFIEFRKEKKTSFKCDIDLEGVTDLMELTYNAEFWTELGEKCLSCGQCTMVCPTCTCFNTIDEIELNKPEGHRRRYWDSCMFKEYSLVAGGHNFREARSDRLKLWYTHKLKAFIGKFGSSSCVGCGRCIETCPVDINVYTVAAKIKGKEVVK
ncbi:4Fe-4S dicluster domain-containing protein [Candidatus Dependentiae bacterium]|nr:4Fe-4S dicluster domain-containing protein [Candidatus Dependentiae bacterium]